MINKNKRNANKSKGPWGMHEFDFTYRKKGDTVKRNRFIQAPCEDSAKEQFTYIMNKAGTEVEILDIKCPDNN
mgnify:FL=1|tara:strand:+ start:22987 stop:23205 length:219 start_codon:yes stop_codon:yes gene_type:complete